MRILLTIFLLVTNIYVSYSQDPNHFVIGKKQFAHTNIYTLLYDDSTDILYAGTNNGIYAYIQNKFVKLNAMPNEHPNALFQLMKGKNGEIYCSNLNGKIFKIENLKIKLFTEIPEKHLSNRFSFFVANDNNLIVASKALIRVNEQGEQKVLFEGRRNTSLVQRQILGGEIFVSIENNGFNMYRYKKDSLKIVNKDINPWTEKDVFNKLHAHYFTLNNKLFYALENTFFLSKDKSIKIAVKEKSFQQLKALNQNEVIVMSKTKGAKILSLKNNRLIIKQTLFEDEFLSSTTQNNNGTLFFGTFGEGIKVVPNLKVVSNAPKELFLGITSSQKDDVFVSTRSGKILDAKTLKTIATHSTNIDNVFYAKGFLKEDFLSQHNIFFLSSLKDVFKIDSTLLLISGSNGVGVIAKNRSHPLLESLYFKIETMPNHYILFNSVKRIGAIAFDKEDTLIYYNTREGVFTKKWNFNKTEEIFYKNKSFYCSDILMHKNSIIFASKKDGILFYKKNKFIKSISKNDGLYSNTVQKIEEKDGKLYILSKKGFQIYNLKTKKFEEIGISEGLNQSAVTNFSISNNKIHFIEKHKYYNISFEEITSKYRIQKLHIENVYVNSDKINFLEKNSFKQKENKFDFYFDYRDIETKQETKILYKLEGFNKHWETAYSSENSIRFQSLPIGKYTFKIKAVYRNQESNSFEYQFEINAPFWQQWWFYVWIIIISGFIVYLISYLKIKIAEKENKVILDKEILKKELAQSNLKAFRAQMNPHFIFNALNSIQDLVLQEEIDKSYDYIVLFADLVRNTLNYSEEDFISIDKEMKFLSVYLDLEKLRFGDDLIYEITYKGSKEVKIPSMMLQVFIENALLHGLLNRKGHKKLSITFEMKNQMVCTIIDNGIGRKKAKEIKERQKRSNSSFSTNAIKKRMKILSNQYNMEASFEYEDILENGEINGTKVVIILPFKNF